MVQPSSVDRQKRKRLAPVSTAQTSGCSRGRRIDVYLFSVWLPAAPQA
jgi:hypothetical protein